MEPTQVARRRSLARRLIKGLLFLIVKPTVVLVLFTRRHRFVSLCLAIILAGLLLGATGGSSVLALPGLGSHAVPADRPIAVEAYLTGQQTYQARLMWEALGDDLKQAMLQRGESPEALQRRLDHEQRAGLRYDGYRYVGGAPLDDGRSVHLYVVSVTAAAPQGERSTRVPYTFVVDAAGKIIAID
jgi:hypothetical protein